VLALSAATARNPDAAGEYHGYIKVFQWDASAGQYSQRGSTIWGPTNGYLAGYRSTRLSSDGTVLLTANDRMPGNKVEVFKFNGSNYVPYGDPITASQYIITADISGDGSKVMLIYWNTPTAKLYAAPPPPTTSPTPVSVLVCSWMFIFFSSQEPLAASRVPQRARPTAHHK